jgi:BlaI family transcriptional regulator, penicillinase repressor
VNRLGDLERAIMDVLWDASEWLTVRQVSEQLTERDLAHTTVMTVLDRLSKKGFARRERDGRAWRYRASESREAYVAELMLSALDQTGDRQAALARFVRSVSGAEAQALLGALEALGDAREGLGGSSRRASTAAGS